MDDSRATIQKQMAEFAAFLGDEYRGYVGKEISRGHAVPSQTDFAKWLGVTQASFSNWINQVRPPNRDNLDQLATRLGPRVYDIFGVPQHMPKDRLARLVMQRWHNLSENQRKQLEEMTENWIEDNEQRGGSAKIINTTPA